MLAYILYMDPMGNNFQCIPSSRKLTESNVAIRAIRAMSVQPAESKGPIFWTKWPKTSENHGKTLKVLYRESRSYS